jgi:hypothetical protein
MLAEGLQKLQQQIRGPPSVRSIGIKKKRKNQGQLQVDSGLDYSGQARKVALEHLQLSGHHPSSLVLTGMAVILQKTQAIRNRRVSQVVPLPPSGENSEKTKRDLKSF